MVPRQPSLIEAGSPEWIATPPFDTDEMVPPVTLKRSEQRMESPLVAVERTVPPDNLLSSAHKLLAAHNHPYTSNTPSESSSAA